jgi:N-sulfoglucosamine sulfohydrolase
VSKPNILYLHSHDTGRYIEPYGHAIPTPNLMRLAKSGVLFRKAFCGAPTCSPSRAALLTGQSAHAAGMIGLAHRGFALHDYEEHIVHTLRAAGYESTLVGVQHVAADPRAIGYDHVAEVRGHGADHVAAAGVDFLANKPQQPFFLDVGFSETHREFPQEGAEFADADYCLPFPVLPDTPEIRRDTAAFKASARLLDDGVGKVLSALDASGLADNTLVIYTTDHGPAFPDMKCSLTDHGIGVSLILRAPGASDGSGPMFEGGRAVDAMVSQIDVFPTLCDLLDIERPGWLTGVSFAPTLRGEADEVNDAVFAEVTYHAAYEPKRAVRTQRYKYIRRYGTRTTPVLPNCDDSPSKDVWLANGWRNRPIPFEELFDLVFDPQERNNLADKPAYGEILTEMRGRLNTWMLDTDDPLLLGSVRAPSGAQANDVDGVSPREPAQIVE